MAEKTLLRKMHNDRPVPQGLPQHFYQQYKKYKNGEYFVSTSQGNNCFEICGKPSLVKNIINSNENETLIVFGSFIDIQSFYNYPLDSTQLGVYRTKICLENYKLSTSVNL